ncbi:hypothetical protein ACFC96_33155 [Streptomyces sp. NPDC055955]|uniref:hypothetical protein n=1 Tax=Streptomyces sp. NPDC055955 TaxID=3345665 RepID=UPI0035E25AA0
MRTVTVAPPDTVTAEPDPTEPCASEPPGELPRAARPLPRLRVRPGPACSARPAAATLFAGRLFDVDPGLTPVSATTLGFAPAHPLVAATVAALAAVPVATLRPDAKGLPESVPDVPASGRGAVSAPVSL